MLDTLLPKPAPRITAREALFDLGVYMLYIATLSSGVLIAIAH